MKVLHIVWTLRFGGIETMLMNIANEQKALGNEVGILLIDKDAIDPELIKKLDKDVMLFYANRRYGKYDLLAYLRMNWIIYKYAPDVIHLHSAAIYKYLCPVLQKACNLTLHDLCNKPNTDHIEKINKIFAISESVAEDLMKKKGVYSIVNPNGIRPELIRVKKKLHTGGKYRIVQVSRLEHQKKGQHILINACKLLKEDGLGDFTLDFIGDGGSRSYLEQMVKEKGLSNCVRFLGTKDQQYIYDHLCEYDLFVQPSIYEGFGLTVAEAMAAKVPVLVSSGQGPEEVIDFGRCGSVFENGNIKDCAKKIALYLQGKMDETLVEKAFKRVWERYNVKVTVRTYLDRYARNENTENRL